MKRLMEVALSASFACLLAACGGSNNAQAAAPVTPKPAESTPTSETLPEGMDCIIKDSFNKDSQIIRITQASYQSAEVHAESGALVVRSCETLKPKIWVCTGSTIGYVVQVMDNWCIALDLESRTFIEYEDTCSPGHIIATTMDGKLTKAKVEGTVCHAIPSRW